MYKAIHYLDKPFEKMPIINFFDTIILQRNLLLLFYFTVIVQDTSIKSIPNASCSNSEFFKVQYLKKKNPKSWTQSNIRKQMEACDW